jgi:hypothetical protein
MVAVSADIEQAAAMARAIGRYGYQHVRES